MAAAALADSARHGRGISLIELSLSRTSAQILGKRIKSPD